jgi:hypothetical protein
MTPSLGVQLWERDPQALPKTAAGVESLEYPTVTVGVISARFRSARLWPARTVPSGSM